MKTEPTRYILRIRKRCGIGVFVLSLFFSLSLQAQQILERPTELEGISVDEKLGGQIPLSLTFINEKGEAVQLRDALRSGKPLMLSLAYYRCPKLCGLVLNGLCQSAKQLDLELGKEYSILTVSIDPSETSELASAKKRAYTEAFGKPGVEEGWHFWVGRAEASRELARSVGFNYYYDAKRDEYAHPALAVMISPEGKITRYLYGIDFRRFDLKLALLEAGEGKIGTTLERLILSCFHYDPKANSYVPFAIGMMRLGGALTIIGVGLILGMFWVRESRKHKERGKTNIELPLN